MPLQALSPGKEQAQGDLKLWEGMRYGQGYSGLGWG